MTERRTDRRVVVITGGSAGAGRAAARAFAHKGQQTDRPVPHDRPDNLEKPVAGEQGAHGIFDDMSKPRSLQSQLSMHRRMAAGTLSGAGLVLLAARRRR